MNGLRTHNTIRQASARITRREMARRADRADAIVATVSIVALVILLAIQIAGRGAA